MDQHKNYMPGSTQGAVVLDVKPLRTLSPMFPPTFGFNLHASSGTPPFVCVSPFDPSASQPPPGQSSNGNAVIAGLSKSPIQTPPPMVAPLNVFAGMCDGATTPGERMTKQKISTSDAEGNQKKRRLRTKHTKVLDIALLPSAFNDPREAVEVVLMTYEALRRRMLQLEEANNANKASHLRAGTVMMDNELRTNAVKRIGSVPGVNIGDMFFFRFELCLIGLHAPTMAGIDCLTTKLGDENDTVAVSIVSSGVYEDEADDVDVLIYTGQGGSKVNDKKTQVNDQKLERGNLALERSLHQGNLIRVIRGTKDWSGVQNLKIYYYDGLYKVHESWVEKGKTGFNIFKYKLLREPGQPEGFAVWKMIEKWKQNPSSRGNVISPDISAGLESVPVCLVNEVDEEQGPRPFSYTTKLRYMKPVNIMAPLHGCTCMNACLPTDSCYCSKQNGGDLAYSLFGSLVRRMPLIHECNSSCKCTANCRNRVTQKGIKLRLEVFKTKDRGWGVRSWEPIRAGTFICEFVGDVVDTHRIEQDGEEDSYVFNPNAFNKSFKWNYGPELLGEPSLEENPNPLPFVISAKGSGNVSRFLNHSCSPNVFWQPVQHDHGDESHPHIMFFAIKHVPPMMELTYDYGQGGHRQKECLCGSRNCRGVFG